MVALVALSLVVSLTVPALAIRIIPGERSNSLDEVETPAKWGWSRRISGSATPTVSSPDEHLVVDLPLLRQEEDDPPMTEMFAGHLPASEDGHKNLFYWLVSPPDDVDAMNSLDVPLVIWLNGGPGCSSMEGFFLENGPVRFVSEESTGKWHLRPRPHSWHFAPAYVLYIDQPVGTGLSFTTKGDYCRSDEEVNRDFVYFLEEFLLLHREKFLTYDDHGPPGLRRPLFFTGESHAGHYIPSMIDHIISKNEPTRVSISVAGAAIGNGWMDPYHQYSGSEAAYGMGLLNIAQKAHLDAEEVKCQAQLDAGKLDSSLCLNLIDAIKNHSHGSRSATTPVSYDISKYEMRGISSFPPGHNLIESYLGVRNGEMDVEYMDVLDALHAGDSISVGHQHYQNCANPPYNALSHQDGKGVVQEVANILDHPDKMRLLFFNGMNDLVCNHVGNEVTLQKLPWNRAEDWILAPRSAWHINQNEPPVGYIQELDNLIFLKLPNAGHSECCVLLPTV